MAKTVKLNLTEEEKVLVQEGNTEVLPYLLKACTESTKEGFPYYIGKSGYLCFPIRNMKETQIICIKENYSSPYDDCDVIHFMNDKLLFHTLDINNGLLPSKPGDANVFPSPVYKAGHNILIAESPCGKKYAYEIDSTSSTWGSYDKPYGLINALVTSTVLDVTNVKIEDSFVIYKNLLLTEDSFVVGSSNKRLLKCYRTRKGFIKAAQYDLYYKKDQNIGLYKKSPKYDDLRKDEGEFFVIGHHIFDIPNGISIYDIDEIL